MLTPIAKSWPAQWCLQANSLAIQVHGGYGYTREYDVEQHFRDQRLNMIHEGTHGIQALDLLGRKVVMDDGAGLGALAAAITETVTTASVCGDSELAGFGTQLATTLDAIRAVTVRLHAAASPELTLASAATYLEVVGHLVIAWVWLGQALAALGKDGDLYRGKRQAARYFFRSELPRTGPQLSLLNSLDDTALAMADEWF